ncbi:MAG: translesion error-prone DNA polymerase V autoproteolytic subunit [Thermodesulfobacteriota bacterium]|nr:translesion error-prone DNA polymerase V autoproteolytic subunit [Thermodesulfobacteriota bacterium]
MTDILQNASIGFSRAGEDFWDRSLDLNRLLVSHPVATFFMRVSGDAMKNAGITAGDILVVDRALAPAHNDVVAAVVEGEFLVRRLWHRNKQARLVAEEPGAVPLGIDPDAGVTIWGVVTCVLHFFRHPGHSDQ